LDVLNNINCNEIYRNGTPISSTLSLFLPLTGGLLSGPLTGTTISATNMSATNISVDNFVGSGNVLIGTSTNNGSKLNITASTSGDGGTNNGNNSLVYIRQTSGWTGSQQWALYVSGYTYLSGF
jgi:hypothetical protein